MQMSPEQAEVIAIKALGWLAGHDDLGPAFLGHTGASAEDLRARTADPAFLASVLEYLTMDDQWIIAFCDAENLAYDRPLRARYSLPGAEMMNWT
jgi:hypothetical protein